MRILLDTNIFLDILLNRPPYNTSSYDVVKKILSEGNSIYISPSSINDINYILSKNYHSKSKAKMVVLSLFKMCKVASINTSSMYDAYLSDFKDFEDSIINSVAMHNFCTTIITRNKSDFINSELNILTPSEYLNL